MPRGAAFRYALTVVLLGLLGTPTPAQSPSAPEAPSAANAVKSDALIKQAGLGDAPYANPVTTPGGTLTPNPVVEGPERGRTWLLKFDATWLTGGASNLGMQDYEAAMIADLPLPGGLAPLQISPGGAVRLWQGPISRSGPPSYLDPIAYGLPQIAIWPPPPPATYLYMPPGPDLPPHVYDLYLDIGWRPRLAEWLFADLGVTPGLYSDFEDLREDSFRLRGRGLAIIAFSEQLQLVAGVLYVNRDIVNLLPAGGLMWNPTPNYRLNFLFPQPKFAYRFANDGAREWWGYLAGEFGGGSWSITRADGSPDSVDYRDWRVIGGVEFVRCTGLRGRFEAGYVFNRVVEFDDRFTPDYEPSSTVMLRAGFTF